MKFFLNFFDNSLNTIMVFPGSKIQVPFKLTIFHKIVAVTLHTPSFWDCFSTRVHESDREVAFPDQGVTYRRFDKLTPEQFCANTGIPIKDDHYPFKTGYFQSCQGDLKTLKTLIHIAAQDSDLSGITLTSTEPIPLKTLLPLLQSAQSKKLTHDLLKGRGLTRDDLKDLIQNGISTLTGVDLSNVDLSELS
ncbi:MAG: hypothetical protein O3A01_04150, partial [bacterium]|nr:hypothetical protein [bacterium]